MRFIYTKIFGIFFLCVLVTALLLFLEVRGLLGPIKTAVLQLPRPVVFLAKSVTEPVKDFFITLYRLRQIAEENVLLESKVASLQQDLSQLEQEKRENEALRKELGFVRGSRLQAAPCTVMARNSFDFSDAVVLGCGTEQGVLEGQAVVSQGYLVGKIIHASKTSSTALLVTNSKFSTDAKLSKTGADIIVRGSFGSGLILDQLSQNSQLEKGWLVVTAGINERIPKNILIGEVGEIISTPNDLFKKATLLNPVDFDNLEFVSVIK